MLRRKFTPEKVQIEMARRFMAGEPAVMLAREIGHKSTAAIYKWQYKHFPESVPLDKVPVKRNTHDEFIQWLEDLMGGPVGLEAFYRKFKKHVLKKWGPGPPQNTNKMVRNYLTDDQRWDIIDDYDDGARMVDLAKKYGRSPQTINYTVNVWRDRQ